jgi:hypothetical protein
MALWNEAKLKTESELRGNTPQGQLATAYLVAINGIKGELAQLENGGYAPTDASWKTVNEQVRADRGAKAQIRAVEEMRQIINFRIKGMDSIGGGYGPTSPNMYRDQGGQPQGPQPAAGAAAGDADTVKLKPLDDAVKKQIRKLNNEGFTREQTEEWLRKRGYDPESE